MPQAPKTKIQPGCDGHSSDRHAKRPPRWGTEALAMASGGRVRLSALSELFKILPAEAATILLQSVLDRLRLPRPPNDLAGHVW